MLHVTLVWTSVQPQPSLTFKCKPRSRIFLLSHKLFFQSPKQLLWISPVLQCCRSQLHKLVPSHNSSRSSDLRSTLYIWSFSLCGLMSLQCLAKCPYLSRKQQSVSIFSSLFVCPTAAFIPHIDCYTYRAVELASVRYIFNSNILERKIFSLSEHK